MRAWPCPLSSSGSKFSIPFIYQWMPVIKTAINPWCIHSLGILVHHTICSAIFTPVERVRIMFNIKMTFVLHKADEIDALSKSVTWVTGWKTRTGWRFSVEVPSRMQKRWVFRAQQFPDYRTALRRSMVILVWRWRTSLLPPLYWARQLRCSHYR